jgi:hypothetical protein
MLLDALFCAEESFEDENGVEEEEKGVRTMMKM